MTQKPLHVTGIGNAIVDIMTYVSDDFITTHHLTKGAMTLVDEEKADTLYQAMGACAECSGGSVANTMAAIAGFGGKGAFIGKVADDAFGDIFTKDMHKTGIRFHTTRADTEQGASAQCLIVVTPDGERTMNTHLGVAALVREEDIDEVLIAASQVLYIEGYLWDAPDTIAALRKAVSFSQAANTKVAFTLSDLFCVERHREQFLSLIEHGLDILFANEAEICALFETSDFSEAMQAIQGKCPIACLTRSEKGSVIVTPDAQISIDAVPVQEVVDTTGAGDLYAAGVLYGITHGMELAEAGALGARAAAQIIHQLGARSLKPLSPLLGG